MRQKSGTIFVGQATNASTGENFRITSCVILKLLRGLRLKIFVQDNGLGPFRGEGLFKSVPKEEKYVKEMLYRHQTKLAPIRFSTGS